MSLALGWQAWVTLCTLVGLVIALVREWFSPDLLFLGSVALLLCTGVLTPGEAFAGLSNEALITVGALFVVAAGVHRTGALSFADHALFAGSRRLSRVLPRLMLTTAALSAFLNNTPIVAMLIPRVKAWSEENGISTSKLMIPLSYAAILGGMTTLIGTSTNLLVSGLMEAQGYEGFGLFDLTLVGVPAALCGIAYLAFVGHRLLPARSVEETSFDQDLQEYLFDVDVRRDAPFEGQSVEEAGLRELEGAYLAHLERDGRLIATTPDTLLEGGDTLMFQGAPDALEKLLGYPGLERSVRMPVSEQATLPLFEAVIAPSSQLVGKTLRDANFRETYDGVVLGLHRRDEHIEGSLSRQPLKSGDLLLIEAPDGFSDRWGQDHREFFLVAPRRPKHPRRRSKAPLAMAVLGGVILAALLGVTSIAASAFIGALVMVALRCVSVQEAAAAIDVTVLTIIASALAIGRAIEKTGLADLLSLLIVDGAAVFGTVGVMAALYLATSLLTELVTNNGAAAIMLAIALSAAEQVGAPPDAFAIAVALAASASFMTPIGYQTNLMVMAPGGYRFSDYLKAGVVLDAIVGSTIIAMIYLVYL